MDANETIQSFFKRVREMESKFQEEDVKARLQSEADNVANMEDDDKTQEAKMVYWHCWIIYL